ncbi:MAG: hypothetical protein HQL72_14480 [Magnetococcales bacterium]|nr:hypothetical protein [Magnetococcales bacterium]
MTMTPKLAYVTAFIYLISADKKIDSWEPIQLKADLKGLIKEEEIASIPGLISRCIDYARKTPLSRFLSESVAVLDKDQRFCILLNLLDAIHKNGEVNPKEMELVRKIGDGYDVADGRLQPYEKMFVIKNDMKVFLR